MTDTLETLRNRVKANENIIASYKADLNDNPLYALQWYSEQAIIAALWVENGNYAIAAIEAGNADKLHIRLTQDVRLMATSASFSTSQVANLVERHRLAVRASILEMLEDNA